MARDSYTYLHLPMIAGIVLLALGDQEDGRRTRDDALRRRCRRSALCGGVALYLLAHVAFRLRNVHTLERAGGSSRSLSAWR